MGKKYTGRHWPQQRAPRRLTRELPYPPLPNHRHPLSSSKPMEGGGKITKMIFFDASEMDGDYGLNSMLSSFQDDGVDAVHRLCDEIFGEPMRALSDFLVSPKVLAWIGYPVPEDPEGRLPSLTCEQVMSMPSTLKGVVSESLRLMNECAKIPWVHLPFDNVNTSNSLYVENPSLLDVIDNDSVIKQVAFSYDATNFDALLFVTEDRVIYKLICEEERKDKVVL